MKSHTEPLERVAPKAIVDPVVYLRVEAGLLAGVIAGVAMASALAFGYSLLDRPVGAPFRLIAATFMGDTALLPSARDAGVAIGLASHLCLSAAFGALFAVITQQRRRGLLALEGAVFGILLAVFMQFIFLPTGINIPLVARMSPIVYLGGHVVFGVFLALVAPIEERLIRSELRRARELAERRRAEEERLAALRPRPRAIEFPVNRAG